MRVRAACLVAAILALPAALLAAPDSVEAFRPSREPVSPAGVRAACDIPPDQHMRNTGGVDRWGRPGMGAGLCVFTSVEVDSRWQGVSALSGFQSWMTHKPGGGYPSKLAAMIAQFCREKGVPEPLYVQHTGGDPKFLELAIKTRRAVGVTYAGQDDFYSGPIDHMVSLVHLDADSACIVDNNRPGQFVWMGRAEFLSRWKARGGGWGVVLLDSPPPPADAAQTFTSAPACVCGDDCKCKKGDCPGKCPVVKPYQQFCPTCPNGNCPLPRRPTVVLAPPPVAGANVDRSASSVCVRRDLGGGVAECGTGTVIASGGGKSLVLTNAHVAPDGSKPLEVYAGEKKYEARHLAASRLDPNEVDLAMLEIDAELPAAPFAESPAPVGTAVYQWGYGGRFAGQAPTFKEGVTVAQENWLGPKTLRTTVKGQQGDSGAGLFDARGRIVGVCWGGDESHQFANKLDAVKAWVKEKAGDRLAPKPKPVEAAPAPHGIQNHGIDREELDKLTGDGSHRYWVRDRETSRAAAHNLIEGSAGLTDDSDRYFLSVVGDDATQRQLDAAFNDPRLAKFRDRLFIRVYPKDSWVVRDRLKSLVTVQEPAPKGGKVVGTLDRLDVELLLQLLQMIFEPQPPEPSPAPAPAPQPQPAPGPNVVPAPPPAPNDNPAPAPAQPTNPLAILALAALVAYFILRKPQTPTPESK